MSVCTDRNNLEYWFPILAQANVKVPKTLIVNAPEDLNLIRYFCDEQYRPDNFSSFIDAVKAACDQVGCPSFLRTGHTSGKHYWNQTCYLTDHEPKTIAYHVQELVDYASCAGILGLPCETWVARELLKTEPAFHAFHGRLPITKERRYFIKNRAIIGHHPYWPDHAIVTPSEKDWRARLNAINRETKAEVEELTYETSKVAGYFHDAWSVDWLHTTDRGWVCIDMALAADSFCDFEHPCAPKPHEIGQ